ncbi:MAG TPA: class I SAM-dependent methyltransferase [Gaiellaceae bacterium]|nr:class I SAM-dependent methyltransferase [Gaiellaceae bacterium]
MSDATDTPVLPENEESQRAWDGVLFDRFLHFREQVVAGLAQFGVEAMRRFPPAEGDRVLDIGCGFGDSTAQLAELVGPTGSALGVDIAPRFIQIARAEAVLPNVRYEVKDVQAGAFDEQFDYAFARFGTMFFANPVPAMRNVRNALTDDGRMCIVVWRRREENPWLYVAEQVVKPLLPEADEDIDEAHCGPGPFSMAGADTVSMQLRAAGFHEIAFQRFDTPFFLGPDLEQAIEMNLAIGPAAEALRFAGDQGEAMRPKLEALLREALAPYATGDGVFLDSSVWFITASAA